MQVAQGDTDDDVSTTRSASAVLELTKGDVVAVYHANNVGTIDEGLDSMFSGFLIKPLP